MNKLNYMKIFLLLFLLLFAFMGVCKADSACKHQYKIVHLDEEYSGFTHFSRWYSRAYGTSDRQAMLSFGPCRVDNLTASWNFNNATEVNQRLRSIFYKNNIRCPIFKSEVFLSLLRNKKLTIVGDSIAQQMFEGLHNSLTKHATLYSNGSEYSTKITPEFTNRNTRTMSIIYGAYNASIFFCFNPFLRSHSTWNYCTEEYYRDADILILGIGIWYKPMEAEEHAHLSYEKSRAISLAELKHDVASKRLFLNQTMPHAKVLWRLQPQVGNIDELRYLNHSTAISHNNATWWSNMNHSATWVTEYNAALIKNAEEYGDLVIDWFTLSAQYIEFFTGLRGIPVHADSIHYVGDGLPRGGTILLQDALYDLNQK